MIAVLAASLSKYGLGFLVRNRVSYLILSFFIERWVNSLANRGLILLNTGAMLLDTTITEAALLEAWRAADKALIEAQKTGLPLNRERMKAIDDEVFNAFYKHAVFI